MDNATVAQALYGSPAQSQEAGSTLMSDSVPAKAPTAPEATARDAAAVLYGGDPSQQPAPQPSQPMEKAEVEKALYGEDGGEAAPVEVPADIKAARESDTARQLYSPQMTFRDAIPDTALDHGPDADKIPVETRRAVVGELREMAADLGMSGNDVDAFKSAAASITKTPTEEQRIAWREQAVQRLNETYGDQAAQVLRDVQKFVSADPRRVRMLEVNGLGDHPDTVMLFAKLARQARTAGKLK